MILNQLSSISDDFMFKLALLNFCLSYLHGFCGHRKPEGTLAFINERFEKGKCYRNVLPEQFKHDLMRKQNFNLFTQTCVGRLCQ